MTAATQTPPADTKAEKKMTAAEAAKRVKRTVVVQKKDDDGKVVGTTTKYVAVEASEVLAFKDYTTHVVVVTKDGQKFTDAEV